MRRLFLMMLILGMLVAGVPAAADEHETLPEHPHVLLLGVQLDLTDPEHPVLTDVGKCVDLAANQALPLSAHHEHVHFGPANEALFTHTGNVVTATAPFPGIPWTDCASLLAFFGLD